MRFKVFCLAIICLLLLVDCGAKFNDAKASSIIKEAFELTKYDTLEILGIFMESENIAEVKFKLNEIEFSSKMKRYVDKGWHLDKVQDNLGKWFLPEDINLLCVSKAVDFIKKEFELTEEESLKILGFTTLSTDVIAVKFKINDVQLRSKFGRKDNSNYLYMHDLQNELGESVYRRDIVFNEPSRLKKSMRDITVISTALADYVTDNGIVPKQDGNYDRNSSFYKALSPFYVKRLPIKDGWGNNYFVYCGKACNGKYGISGCQRDDFIVISYGRDGEKENWKFDPGNPEAGLIEMKTEDDFNIDLIMWNGSWIRAPRTSRY